MIPRYWASSYKTVDESQPPFDELHLLLSDPDAPLPVLGVRCVITLEGAAPRIGLVAVASEDESHPLTPPQVQRLEAILHDGIRFELSPASLERVLEVGPSPIVLVVDSVPEEQPANA